jgi:general stress protein 26
MSEPVTKIDARFSEPGAAATPWSQTREVIESAQLFWISTVRVDGRPHVTPLVAVWLDEALHFSTGEEEQKCLNLHANPNVVLTTGCNSWNEGLDVAVEGSAILVTDDAQLTRLAHAWTAKWDGDWQYQVKDGRFQHPHGGDALVYSVVPTRVLAFGKGHFTHTSYRF